MADLVNVKDTMTINGQLTIKLLNNYIPNIGAKFTIVKASFVKGEFTSTKFPDLGAEKAFSVIYTDTTLEVEVVKPNIVALNKEHTQNLVIYPNPAINKLFIKSENGELSKVTISDFQGKVMINTSQTTNEVDVSNLNTGVYFISVKTGESVITQKFIKQ